MTRDYYHRSPRRAGFTLVEMLVSTALILFVMVILASVFTTGLNALRDLRGKGHLQQHLQSAASTLRSDLSKPHFGRESTALQGPYLSQQRLDLYDWTPPKEGFFRIWQGLASQSEGKDNDQIDSYVMPNGYQANGTFDGYKLPALHFTVRSEPNTAQGSGRDKLTGTSSLSALLDPNANSPNPMAPNAKVYSSLFELLKYYPPTTGAPKTSNYLGTDPGFYSPWTEVSYFVRPSGQLAGASPLYTLYRRRRVLLDIKPANLSNNLAIAYANSDGKPVVPQLNDVSLYQAMQPSNGGAVPNSPSDTYYFNTPSDVTAPYRRQDMRPLPASGTTVYTPEAAGGLYVPNTTGVLTSGSSYRSLNDLFSTQTIGASTVPSPGGDDILLENVLSLEVKATWDVPTDPRINIHPTTGNAKVAAPTPYYGGTTGTSVLNSDYPFDNLPLSPDIFGNDVFSQQQLRVFDTWRGEETGLYADWNKQYENGRAASTPNAAVTIPLRIRVKAIQIRIRVWDIKTQQARQVTVIQDL